MRIGIGYDIHKLVPGRPFTIGGVTLESDRGPEGHSDGDALSHAIADALLGAAGLGDIGQWFPPGDPRYKNASSLFFLEKIMESVREKGFEIGNIDSIVICEKPKLSPHYSTLREKLAAALSIDVEKISVKSKTNEKLGEIGSGDAVAAQAIALLL